MQRISPGHRPRHSRRRSLQFETLESRLPLAGSLPGVPNLINQFGALQSHAEGLAFNLPEASGAPDASISNHYQGIVRYPGTGVPIFYLTQKHSSGGYLHVARMGSRDASGERLRSNLQLIGADTEDTAPPSSDTWTRSLRLNGVLKFRGETLRSYVHPGGMAIVDNVLFVAMDTPNTLGAGQVGGKGSIVLFDLGAGGANRWNPLPLHVLPVNHMIDNLAVVKESGRYLIYTNGDGGKLINIYRTNSLNLRSSDLKLQFVQLWTPNSAANYSGPAWPTGSSAHQSATFVQHSNSFNPSVSAALYLIAMRHDGPLGVPLVGDDFADLYRVTHTSSGGLRLAHQKTYHATLRYDQAGNLGNFAAAGSAYVSPSGELILYSTPHDDEDKFSPVDNVRIAEMRHRNVVRPSGPLHRPSANAGGPYSVVEGGDVTLKGVATPAVGPWVELFDDKNFRDRSIMVDYRDRARLELSNFENLDGFGDKTSSVRWRLPAGMKVELFEDHGFKGAKYVLEGNGAVRQIANLGSFGDKVSSLRFVGRNPADDLTYAWDLDGDGIFGETGAEATRGAEVGAKPIFFTNNADGPQRYPLVLRVTDGMGASTTVSTGIVVLNAPPVVTLKGPGPGLVNQSLTFRLTAHDPSSADSAARVTYTVDFGDGRTGTFKPGKLSQSSALNLSHAYTKTGIYRFTVKATDRDGGESDLVTYFIQIAEMNDPG